MDPLHWGDLELGAPFISVGEAKHKSCPSCLESYTGVERTKVVESYATERFMELPPVRARARSGCARNSRFPRSMKEEENCGGGYGTPGKRTQDAAATQEKPRGRSPDHPVWAGRDQRPLSSTA